MNRTMKPMYTGSSPYARRRRRRRKILILCGVLVVLLAVAALLAATLSDRDDPAQHRIKAVEGALVDAPPVPEEIARRIAAMRARKEALEAYNRAVAEGTAANHPALLPALYNPDGVKTAYLTFDDGPSSITEQILDILAKHNIRATFFMLGMRAEQNPALVKRVYEAGHSIGNHSYSHDYGKVYASPESFAEELNHSRQVINTALGLDYNNLIFRFPGGSFEEYKHPYRDVLLEHGYQYIDWNALNGDSEKQNPDSAYLMNTLKESVAGREDVVVLMHDASAKQVTADTLEEMISFLKGEGYTFLPLTNSAY
ncbi:MAG: polysaccharide deacetylase [Ruminococcaceae bacterium]|nr:polysaccharide deacetylase [Oscillospiraceae bacterium]